MQLYSAIHQLVLSRQILLPTCYSTALSSLTAIAYRGLINYYQLPLPKYMYTYFYLYY